VSKDVKQVRVENLRWRRIGLRLGSLHDSRIELTREAEALLAPSTQKVIPKSIKEQKGSLGYAKRHPV
jgi:NOL1/NOP2/fmu family ribosome biogenesis protein